MPIKFLLLGGGCGLFGRGGGSADCIFMGVGIFPSSATFLTKCIVFFPVLKRLACGKQSSCLGWIYKLSGGKESSLKLPLFLLDFYSRGRKNHDSHRRDRI